MESLKKIFYLVLISFFMLVIKVDSKIMTALHLSHEKQQQSFTNILTASDKNNQRQKAKDKLRPKLTHNSPRRKKKKNNSVKRK